MLVIIKIDINRQIFLKIKKLENEEVDIKRQI